MRHNPLIPMNSSLPRSSAGTTVRDAVIGWAAMGALGLAFSLRAQSDNFNSGTLSPSWQHYDSGQIIYGSTGASGYGASYTLPSDGAGGHALRIQVPGDTPYDLAPYSLGPARALAFRADVTYGARFSMGVNVIGWNNGIDQAFGPFWFIANPGPGTTTGYVATWEATANQMRISTVTDEQPTTVAQTDNVVLDPAQRYRLVASSHDGSTFLAQVFSTTNLSLPVAGCIAADSTYLGGYLGLLVYDGTTPSVTGADVTYDNYNATAPGAGALPATVAHVSPAPGQKVADLYLTNIIAILDRDTAVDPASILLWLDGTLIPAGSVNITPSITEPNNPASATQSFNGATASYPIPNLLPWGTVHTNTVAFSDAKGVWQTNTWSWTAYYPYLFASNSLPVGSLSAHGFQVRTAWSANGGVNLNNSLTRALEQLAIPPAIQVDLAATSIVSELNWNLNGSPNNVPGLCPGNQINIAVEATAYLHLTAGAHRFSVNTDDRAGFYSGTTPWDPNATVLFESPNNTANQTFDFVVEAEGLYPFRAIWEQTGGGAVLQLTAVDPTGTNPNAVVGDPSEPPGAVDVYYPVVCFSAPTLAGPFVADATAQATAMNLTTTPVTGDCGNVVDQMVSGGSGSFTVPLSGPRRFFRISAPLPSKVEAITLEAGPNLVISYQLN